MNLKTNGRRNTVLAFGLSVFSFVASSQSQILIDLPDLSLQPNLANQSFDLFVQNSGSAFAVTGILTETQVSADASSGPTISAVDVITGTIFASNNNGSSGGGAITPRVFERSTLTGSGTVNIPSGSSKYATITFDTTGLSSGSFSFTANTLNGATVYHTSSGDFSPTLQDGTLTIVPEPSTYAAITGAGCLAFGALLRQSRRKQKAS